jgi:hypothetical protein
MGFAAVRLVACYQPKFRQERAGTGKRGADICAARLPWTDIGPLACTTILGGPVFTGLRGGP